MSKFLLPASADHYYGTYAMIRRLLAEEGVRYWKKYLVAFVLMAIVAGCTALIPYFFGQVINQAHINRSMHGVLIGAGIILALFFGKGIATYGQTVMLARIAN